MTPLELFGHRDRVPDSDTALRFWDGELFAHRFVLTKMFSRLVVGERTDVDTLHVTREAVAGLLACAYDVPCTHVSTDAMEVAMECLGGSEWLRSCMRDHGKCKCSGKRKPPVFGEAGGVCKECFRACGDRDPATLEAMWALGFKPIADSAVAELCVAIQGATQKMCTVFRELVREHLGIRSFYVFDHRPPEYSTLRSMPYRLSDAQARTVKAALDPEWCSLVHIGLRNICAIPDASDSARAAKESSTARLPVCDPEDHDAAEALERGSESPCAARRKVKRRKVK